MADLPEALVASRITNTLDRVALDLSPVYAALPWHWLAFVVGPVVWFAGELAKGVWLPTDGSIEPVPFALASVAPLIVGGIAMLVTYWVASLQKVGIVLEVTTHQLSLRHRRRGGSESVTTLLLGDVLRADLDGSLLTLVTRDGERLPVHLPDRSTRTREAVDQFVDDLLLRTAERAGSRSEVPTALKTLRDEPDRS